MPFLRRYTRPRWPPSPLVEDEFVSLSRELHGLSNLGEKPGLEGACARGTVDQYPVIEDLDTSSSTPPPLVLCTGNCSSDEGNGPPTPPIDASHEPFFKSVDLYEAWPMSPRTTAPQTYNFGELSNIVSDPKRRYTRLRSSKEQLFPAQQRSITTPDYHSYPVTVEPKTPKTLPRESPKIREQSPVVPSFSRKMEERFRRHEQRYSRTPRNEEHSSRESLRSSATDSGITPFPRSIKIPGATEKFFLTQSSSAPQSPTREHYRMASPRSSRIFDASAPQSPRYMSNAMQPAAKRTVSFPDEATWARAAPGRRFELKSPRSSPRPLPWASSIPSRRGSLALESKRLVSPKASDLHLSPCPRSVEMPDQQDWSTIRGLQYLNICPSCTENVSNSKFGGFVMPSFPKPSNKIGCSFSDPWVRLAWFQTIKEDLNHLDILYKFTRGSSVCPRNDKANKCWYKAVDPDTKAYLPGFNACSACVRNLEVLMPTLRGTFKRSTVINKRSCDFVTDSPRFVQYIDLLDHAASRAEREGMPRARIHEFISYAKRKTIVKECHLDSPAFRTWHYIPQLPEFTVCEDCYEDVVWPYAKDDKPIARKVLSTPRLLPGSDRASRCRKATCQLYSPRMRAKFREAVQKNDFALLKTAVLKRYDVEQGYQARRSKLLERWDRGYDVDLELRKNKVPWRNAWE